MYLSEIYAENFRIFGAGDKALCLKLQPGLNALVGENDSGKTAIIDAIRFCLWTTSQDYHRLTDDDFHCSQEGRAKNLIIRCKFENLSALDAGTFMEWLSMSEDKKPELYITVSARRADIQGQVRARIFVTSHSGKNGDGPSVEGMMRELLRATYLRPLRDAEAELSAGRGSRLSQILANHPEIAKEASDDFDEEQDTASTLVGIVKRAEHHIKVNPSVTGARDHINSEYFSKLQVGQDLLESDVGVASDSSLSRILEKLELTISDASRLQENTPKGLGVNNALFMAAELILLGAKQENYPLLLIEEPEAHLHPQLQARVVELLKEKAIAESSVQILVTTHSPILASSIPLDSLILVAQGQTFPLARGETKLDASDYAFLERFLDATKANLFFAKGVAIVEGDAENILLPALGEKVGRSFSKHGVSIVNVGHTGLSRYSRIYQRQDGKADIPLRVACIGDIDVAPSGVDEEMQRKLKKKSDYSPEELDELISNRKVGDGGGVKTFVSDEWTFEYDLSFVSVKMARLMHCAIQCAVKAEKNAKKGIWLTEEERKTIRDTAYLEVTVWESANKSREEIALSVYRPLRLGSASKAISAQFAALCVEESDLQMSDLPIYLQEALKYLCPQSVPLTVTTPIKVARRASDIDTLEGG